jgi:hypothetical protein
VKDLCWTSGFTHHQKDFIREAFVAGLSPSQCAAGISLAPEDDEEDNMGESAGIAKYQVAGDDEDHQDDDIYTSEEIGQPQAV